MVKHWVGGSLAVLVLASATGAIAHVGHSHGDEFQQNSSIQSRSAIAVDPATIERIGLKVEPVKLQTLSFGVQATGQIEASPSRQVKVTNPVGGTVIKLLAEPGDRVSAGQPLAVITSGELAELRVAALENRAERQGDVEQAQAHLRMAQQSYERQKVIAQTAIQQAETEQRVAQEQYERDRELLAKGAIARREFLESEAHLATANNALAEAKSQLAVLEAGADLEQARTAVEVAQSRVELSTTSYQTRLQQLGAEANADGTITIKAPISGTVADREVTLGQSAQDAGATLMTLVDNQVVLATANIYEKDLPQVGPGQRVRVTVSSLPNESFEGRITVVGAVVDGETRVVPVKAELDNSSGLLKPSQFAELEVLTDQTAKPVLAVPKTAVVDANGQPLVFVQNGNTFEPVELTLGRQAGELIEVKEGLFEGDQVVTQRAQQLYAQSLRGNGATAASPAEATEPIQAGFRVSDLPWWATLSGAGLLAAGTFGAGAFWANRRHRQLVTARVQLEQAEEHLDLPLLAVPADKSGRENDSFHSAD